METEEAENNEEGITENEDRANRLGGKCRKVECPDSRQKRTLKNLSHEAETAIVNYP